jgi:hypothetical protein
MVTIWRWQLGGWQPGSSVLTAQLLEALARPGCPLCRVEGVTTRHHLEAMLDERVTLPDAHHELLASRGFCHEHTWTLPAAALAAQSSRGVALLYAPVLTDLLRHWIAPAARRHWFVAEQPCPLCRILVGTAPAYRAELAYLLRRRPDDAPARTLCLPHLHAMTPLVDQATAARLFDLARRGRTTGDAGERLALIVGPPPAHALPAAPRCPVCAAALRAARGVPERSGFCRVHAWDRFAATLLDLDATQAAATTAACPACQATEVAVETALRERQPAHRLCLTHLVAAFEQPWLEPTIAFWSLVQLQRDLTRYIDGGKATFRGTLTADEQRAWQSALERFGGEIPGGGITPPADRPLTLWQRWWSRREPVAV